MKMMSINMINNKAARTYSKVKVMPMTMSAMFKFNMEMKTHDWDNVYLAKIPKPVVFSIQTSDHQG